jgi:hypothetical protein
MQRLLHEFISMRPEKRRPRYGRETKRHAEEDTIDLPPEIKYPQMRRVLPRAFRHGRNSAVPSPEGLPFMSRRRSKSSTWRWVASLAVLVVLLVGAAFFGKKIIAHLRAHGMLPGAEPDTAAAAAPGTPVRLTGEAALQKLDDLIAKNPENLAALITRGNLYAEEKKWDLAQKDYETAASVDPAKISPKINLAEINFRQKKYDAARPQFAALESNADVGDFASYKVFLCDLFAGHEAAARAELDAFNAVG